MKHKWNARAIGQCAQDGGADTAQTKGKPEEKPGDHAHSTGDQLLRVNQDGGKGRSQDQADDRRENADPEQIGVWERQGKRRHAQDRHPDHTLAADSVADRSAQQRARRDGEKKTEEMKLRALNREAELSHQEKRVVARHAREVEIFRKNERDQNSERQDHSLRVRGFPP